MRLLHVFFLVIGVSYAMYSDNGDVVILTKDNFKEKVKQSKDLWFVEFYAPWCGHCKSLAPEWEKAAKALKGIVNLGAVDMTTDQEAGSAYNKSYPTLKIFGESKVSPKDYNGGRTAKDIINSAMTELTALVSKRLG
jgi:protein disulfide-isomerase A6